MSAPTAPHGTIESNLAGWPWGLGGHSDEVAVEAPITARTLLGRFTATHSLTLLDLKVLAFAIERWRQCGGRTASDAATFTLYQLGMAIYGREPDGKERALLRESISRLYKVQLTADGVDARDGSRRRVTKKDGRFFTEKESVHDEFTEEDGVDDRVVAGRRSTTFSVWLGPWLVDQITAGRVTYLDFSTMRQLSGLALRLWVLIQASNYVKGRDGECILATPMIVDERLLGALGLHYGRRADALKALRRAAARVREVDPRYRIFVERDGPEWIMHVARRSRSARSDGQLALEVIEAEVALTA